MELEVGDIVLCTVDRIEKTIVFVNIDGNGEGSIVTSEIAPGRIRNIRDYVVPKKKIVCKVLRISGNRVDLSLRRVTQKEKKEVMDHHNQERSYISILKSVLGKKSEKIIEDIQKKEKLFDFIEELKKDETKLEKIVEKEDAKKILDIINKQKTKKTNIKKEFMLKSTKSNGLELIKNVLGDIKEAKIRYISAGKYGIETESTDLKKADNKLKEIIEKISEKAKKQGMEFQIKEK
jgi:translation initiation factor 2 subunit 1